MAILDLSGQQVARDEIWPKVIQLIMINNMGRKEKKCQFYLLEELPHQIMKRVTL